MIWLLISRLNIIAGQPPGSMRATWREGELKRQQILGIAAAAVLFLGVFAPIVRLPMVGSFNYFRNGEGDGIIVLLLAIVSLALALRRRYELALLHRLDGVCSVGLHVR